jgi:UDP-glucose 4-epimerase
LKKTVCVTGGSGFIGSHLVEALRNNGMHVINIDKVSPDINHADVTYIYADLSKDYFHYDFPQPDVLYHLAATPWSMVKGGSWFDGSQSAFYNNTVGTYLALLKIKPKKIVFSSTANLYGEGRKLKETSPISISSQYGYSKYIAEKIIQASTIPHVIFRFGTVVGTRGRCFPNRLVYSAIHGIPVDVFANGETYRDLVDVNDIVNALLKAPNFEDCITQPIYNLSMGQEVSGLELACLVKEEGMKRGYILNYKLTNFTAPGYVKESTLDIEKIHNEQFWYPLSDINIIIKTLFDYYEGKNAIEPPTWDQV